MLRSGDLAAFGLHRLMMHLREDRGRVNLPEKILDGGPQPLVLALEDDIVVGAAGASQRCDAIDFVKERQEVVLLLVTRDVNDLQIPRGGRHWGRAVLLWLPHVRGMDSRWLGRLRHEENGGAKAETSML
jgi:hypothetical protein